MLLSRLLPTLTTFTVLVVVFTMTTLTDMAKFVLFLSGGSFVGVGSLVQDFRQSVHVQVLTKQLSPLIFS